jgi:hypothetical protein
VGRPTFDDPVLIPEETAKTIPELGDTRRQRDPVAHVKLFTPDSSWTWYVTEYDRQEKVGYGLVYGHEPELGYFSIEEMRSVRGPLGLPIERDVSFSPRPLSQCEDPTHIHENPLKPAKTVEHQEPKKQEQSEEPAEKQKMGPKLKP